MTVGVLSLQGNFQMHQKMLSRLNVSSVLVKHPYDLEKSDGLIIPGGESSTISKLIESHGLRSPIIEYSKNFPIFGTCAGMILLSSTKSSKSVNPLNIMDFTVARNAWGSQIFSFKEKINLKMKKKREFSATFIRAPKVKKISDTIIVLSRLGEEAVLLTDGKHIASSFHPEFGSDTYIHNYFVNLLKNE